MDPHKAPGPDGFSILFFQQFWDIIKFDLLSMFQSFSEHNFDLSKLNRSLICLILKIYDASSIKEYRPISLLNCSFKIFTEALTNRLYPVLDRLIGVDQNVFFLFLK